MALGLAFLWHEIRSKCSEPGVPARRHTVISNMMAGALVLLVLLSFATSPMEAQAALIEPSRSLDAGQAQTGLLTVTSEPPRLPVTVDGESIGQTPIWRRSLESGEHKIRIGDVESPVVIRPNARTFLSLFKGELLDLTRQMDAPKVAMPRAEPPAQANPPRRRAEPSPDGGDFQRWERFLMRTSPTF
jgi:hypothetical protein